MRLACTPLMWLFTVALIGCQSSQGGPGDAAPEAPSEVVIHPLDAAPSQVGDGSAGSPGIDADLDAGFPCLPQDASIPPFVPPRAPRSVCTEMQIQTLYDACFAGTRTACQAFKGVPANSPCILCMETSASDPAWGAIVLFSNDSSEANAAGCIAMIDDDAGSGSCAAAVQARALCRLNACAPSCPSGATQSGLDSLNQCESMASLAVCQSQEIGAQCDQAVRYTPCLYANFQSYFLGLGRIFCAGGLEAGSPEASSDGALD